MAWIHYDRLTPKERFILRYAPHAHGRAAAMAEEMLWRDPHAFTREHHTTVDPRAVMPVATHDTMWLDPFDPNHQAILAAAQQAGAERLQVRAVHPDQADPPRGRPLGSMSRWERQEQALAALKKALDQGKVLWFVRDDASIGVPRKQRKKALRIARRVARDHSLGLRPRDTVNLAEVTQSRIPSWGPRGPGVPVDPPEGPGLLIWFGPVGSKARRRRRRRGSQHVRPLPGTERLPTAEPVSELSLGGSAAVGLEPIFETSHNLRAIGKELALLEDHLLQPTRRCDDCIRKHLVRAEAFGEEGISLDRTGQHVPVFTEILGEIRALQRPALVKDVDLHQLGQAVRTLRKRVVKVAYDPAETWAGQAQVRRGGSAALATPKAPGFELKAGQPVIYRWNKVWYPGKVLPVGSTVTGYKVTSIPQDGMVALEAPDSTSQMWVKEGVVVPLPGGTLMSRVFGAFGKINRYGKRGVGRTPMDSQRLLVLDVIQAVLDRELAFIPPAARDNLIKGAIINAAYESDLDPLADTKKTPRYKAWVAAGKPDPKGSGFDGRTMLAEDSVGLFQLNKPYGAGKGMTQEQRENAVLNTVRIAQEFQARMAETDPKPAKIEAARKAIGVPLLGELVKRAKAGDNPSAGEWAAAWALQVERPWDPLTEGTNRKRTGDEMFPAAGTAPLPRAPTQLVPAPAPAQAPQPVTKTPIIEEGWNPRKGNAWLARWGVAVIDGQVRATTAPPAHPWAVEGVRRALAEEDRAKAAGPGTVVYTEALRSAAESWRELGLRSGQEWPLARAVAVATLAALVPLIYSLHQLIVEKHPTSRLAAVALQENKQLEAKLPTTFLTSRDEARSMTPVLVGAGVLGAAVVGALLFRQMGGAR